MKISVDYSKNTKTEIISIVSAKYVSDYLITLDFSDHHQKIIDFKPFLLKSRHPSISPYLIQENFAKFDIVDGNLNWNDYELIFPVWDLYNGILSS